MRKYSQTSKQFNNTFLINRNNYFIQGDVKNKYLELALNNDELVLGKEAILYSILNYENVIQLHQISQQNKLSDNTNKNKL